MALRPDMHRLLLMVLFATACGSPVGPVLVTARVPTLRVMNRSDRPIYYFVVERESAASVDWRPCTQAETCPAVAPGAQAVVSFDRIVGYEPGEREAIFYWWHLVHAPQDAFAVDSIRAIIVRLGA